MFNFKARQQFENETAKTLQNVQQTLFELQLVLTDLSAENRAKIARRMAQRDTYNRAKILPRAQKQTIPAPDAGEIKRYKITPKFLDKVTLEPLDKITP